MELPANPFTALTFISAPAVLTNASCVLLFGTGNRYGRAVDRAHSLADTVLNGTALDPAELALRIRQLASAQTRTLLIVRALTCFYTAVACFVAATLITLIGTVLAANGPSAAVTVSYRAGFTAGSIGVVTMILGALMLAAESRFSFSVLRQENAFIANRVHSLNPALKTHTE
jgi:hypothetical protein